MEKTRILFLDHNVDVAGGQKSLLALIDSIDRERFTLWASAPKAAAAFRSALQDREVPLIDIGFGRREKPSDNPFVQGIRAIKSALTLAVSTLRLAIACRRRRIDVVHANSIAAALVAGLACRFAPTKVAVRVRSGLVYSNHGVLDIIVLKTANAILCNSHYVRKSIIERLARSSASARAKILHKTAVIYNPIPWEAIRRARRKLAANGKPAALRNGCVNIGVVGRITERKQQHIAVDAMARLVAEEIPLHLWMLGEASPIDGGDFARQVRKRVEGRGLSQRVTFTGFIDDIFPWLGALDMVLMPSIAEPLSRAIYESQAMGSLVIAADDAGNAELISHGETGLLFPPGDADALAARIKEGLDVEMRARCERRALFQTARMFAPERTTLRESDLLCRICGDRPPAAATFSSQRISLDAP